MAEELAKPLPTPTMPPAGKKLGVQDIVGFQQPFLARKSELQTGITGAEGEEAKAKQAQAETLATGKVGAEEQFGKAERGAMQQYQGKLEKEPLPAFIPTKDTAQDMAQLFSVVNVLGLVLGGGGKQNAQLAMNAMNGMLEGHQKGRQDLYRQERDTFEKNFKSMLQKHAEFRKEMDDAIKLASTDKQAGIAAAELAATKAGSPIVQAQLRKGDLLGAYKLVDESQRGANEALKFVERQQEREATERAAERRHQETMKQARDLAAIKAGAQIGDLGAYIQKFTGSAVSKKDAPEIMAAANAIGDAYGIKQTVAEHPEWVGRTGQIKNFFNRTLESINAGTPSPDDAGQPELIFAKRYAEYLVNYERALAGGARGFTVAFQKRFNALLDQNQFNAAGMSNLMDEQSRTIASKAAEKSPTLNRQNLTAMAYDLKSRSEDEMAVKGMQSLLGGSSTPTVREFSTVEDAEKANLPKGTKIKIGGRNATVE